MTRRPTTKAGIVAAVGALLVAVGTTAQSGWLFVLAAGVLGLLGSGVVTWHRLAPATVTQRLPARGRAGETVRVELSVHNPSGKRLPVMHVEDAHPAFESLAVACESIAPRTSATAVLERLAVRRGVFDGSTVVLSTAAPFGLVRTRKRVEVPSRIIVHPAVVDIGELPLPEAAARTADEALAIARSARGDVFAGVRDYRPGDQRRSIHWRTTARTGRLAVREHEEPAKSPVVLVAAGLREGSPGDLVAAAAASVGLYALSRGRPVHCAGEGRLGAHVDDATSLEILDWAAALEPSSSLPEEVVEKALRRWGPGCTIVLFEAERGFTSAAVRQALARGAGVQIVVALPEEDAGDAA